MDKLDFVLGRGDTLGRNASSECRAGQAGFGNVQRERRSAPLPIRHLVRQPGWTAYGDASGDHAPDLQAAECLLRKPSRESDEAQHGTEEQVEKIVARVDGREPDRKSTYREQHPTACVPESPAHPEPWQGRA